MMKKIKSKYIQAIKLYKLDKYTTKEIAAALKIERSTLIKWIQADEEYQLSQKKKFKKITIEQSSMKRQNGYSSWVDMIIIKELNRKKQSKKIKPKFSNVS